MSAGAPATDASALPTASLEPLLRLPLADHPRFAVWPDDDGRNWLGPRDWDALAVLSSPDRVRAAAERTDTGETQRDEEKSEAEGGRCAHANLRQAPSPPLTPHRQNAVLQTADPDGIGHWPTLAEHRSEFTILVFCFEMLHAILTYARRTRFPTSACQLVAEPRVKTVMRFGSSVLLLSLLALFAAPGLSHAAPRKINLGFFDPTFSETDSSRRIAWLGDARDSGASIVRIQADWATVAPNRPTNAPDPNDAAYQWGNVDQAVQVASARGLQVLLSVHNAPNWAEGPGRPRRAARGSWLPRPDAVADFFEAAARRYPGVRRWQVWNEPNLDLYLSPQWKRRRGHINSVAPSHYRLMLNAAYSALKRVSSGNIVVSAGTAPYGDPPGRFRTRPVVFWRNVFKKRTRFDVFAHHPYSVAGPRRHALSSSDVSVPDLRRLTRLVSSAVRHGRALPRRRKPLWITELAWDSDPPDPNGVPESRRARWLGDALFVLWKQGAETVLWFRVRDEDPAAGFDLTNQSGIFTRSGEPKLSRQAFAFPVACERTKGGKLRVWGKAPAPGPVELLRGTRSVGRLTAGSGRVFMTTISGGTGVLAKAGNQTSLKCAP